MEQIRYGKYVGIFTVTFIAMIVVAVSIFSFIDYDPGGSAGIIEVFVSAVVTVFAFARGHNRLPTKEERQKLVWLSFFASLLVVLIPIAGFLAYLGFTYGLADLLQGLDEFLPKLSALVWLLIAVATIVLSYFTVHWGYWIAATRIGKGFLK